MDSLSRKRVNLKLSQLENPGLRLDSENSGAAGHMRVLR